MVAIADVDAFIKDGSAIDEHARHNTTSVYTAAEIFPMLPEKISTDLTSLNFNEDRLAVVVEMVIGADGSLQDSSIYRAWVCNQAKLAYNSVADWLDGNGVVPDAIAAVNGLAENIQLQNKAAQSMKNFRHTQGALSLETIEAKPVFDGDQLSTLESEEKNRAKEIIEDFMIAANGVTARYLSANKFPSIRRVVRVPKRWDRIVEIAAQLKFRLSDVPDSKALEEFLVKQKAADPLRFPDLSLAVIKLLGAGEYIAELSDGDVPGHFGLAVKDYAHSTAPNRRYPDLLTQRLLKAALEGKPVPYSKDELDVLATHCTQAEDAAKKVERQVGKSAAALLLKSRIGEQFDSIVTGASEKGTWVRLLTVPVEGKLVQGFEGMDVGDRLRVKLTSVDVQQGFIDFKKVNSSKH
jgi:exoribonuclease-2